jgi:hypothetical protein
MNWISEYNFDYFVNELQTRANLGILPEVLTFCVRFKIPTVPVNSRHFSKYSRVQNIGTYRLILFFLFYKYLEAFRTRVVNKYTSCKILNNVIDFRIST